MLRVRGGIAGRSDPERALEPGGESILEALEEALTEPIRKAGSLWDDKGEDPPEPASIVRAGEAPGPVRLGPPREEALPPESLQSLQTLGLPLARFRRLVHAQVSFKTDLLAAHPELKQAFFSQRDQERFSKAALRFCSLLRARGRARPLAEALALAARSFYADALAPRFVESALISTLEGFRDFLDSFDLGRVREEGLEFHLLGIPAGEGEIEGRVARALLTNDPALFQEQAGSDAPFMSALRRQAGALDASLGILYCHPFAEERQWQGHDVPMEDGTLVFGLGELARRIRAAQDECDRARLEGRPARKALLLIKNVEALEPGVRTFLQSALADREITHPILGRVPLPDNLQLLFTIRKGAALEDDSFYDRVALRTLPASPSTEARPGLDWPSGVDESNYLDSVSLALENGRPVLRLPGAAIPLSEEFEGVSRENLHDEIYRITGLVLDYQTVRMLAMMAQVRARGLPILRLEGPTGLGKTFAARGYARLLGRPFFSNPVSEGTQLSDWIGGFEQDERGRYLFRADTPLKQRLEQGGVVALSELNTLVDHNEKASLGWWLVQIAEAEPDESGARTIRLTEVPVLEGRPVPIIRIHPRTLIIVDTNPEEGYAARGAQPDILKEMTPALALAPAVTPDASAELKERETASLRRCADMFLKHDWRLGRGISDPERRDRLARALAGVYWEAAALAQSWEDPSARVFSTRELRRMAEDALAGLTSGESEARALAAAAHTHLAGWLTHPDRIEAMRRTISASLPDFEKRPAPRPWLDQLLVMGRPTHLRLPAEADAREALAALEKDPSIELSFVYATEETDRLQMEGSFVPSPSGKGLVFGPGIFARMIEQANASPGKTVVYVFENAHNIRPEQIVALNEFLQEGRIYPKGAGKQLSMPANARVLFLSRRDSPLAWSPAERSRFVEIAGEEDPAWADREAARVLGPSLAGLPGQAADFIERWASGLFARLREAEPGAPAGMLSRSAFRCFLESAERALRAGSHAGPGVSELARRLGQAAAEELAAWAQAEKGSRLAGMMTQGMDLVLREGEPSALDRARADFAVAASGPARGRALAGIRAALDARPPLREKAAGDLKPLDVGRALALLPEEFPQAYVMSSAITPDAGVIVAGNLDNTARVFRLDPALKSYAQVGSDLEHDNQVNSVAVSDGGETIVTGGFDRSARVFRFDGKMGRFVQVQAIGHDGSVEAVSLSASGGAFATRTEDGRVRAFRFDQSAGSFLEVEVSLPSGLRGKPLAITADGGTIAAGFEDGRVRFLAYDTGLDEYAPSGPGIDCGGPVDALSIAPDAGTFVAGTRAPEARVFRRDPGSGAVEQIGPAAALASPARSLAVAAGGECFVAAGKDGMARMFRYEPSKGRYSPVGQAPEYGMGLMSVSIAPGGRSLLLGGAQGLQVYSAEGFIVRDGESVELLDGRISPRSHLAGPVLSVDAPEAASGLKPPTPAPFEPRYGAKPFYFAADGAGGVLLNFRGRWYPTRHRTLASRGRGPLELSEIRAPYEEAPRGLREDDFLVETPILERVEALALKDLARGRGVNLVGGPGAGKTAIARELALLLGLPRFVFQMHGERELSDLLGAFREDPDGNLVLTARPFRDGQGRLRFKPPLLDMIVNGGLFVLDEGAIGERGREMLSWFSGILHRDPEIVLQEFPGRAMRLRVHPDFGLVITSNRPSDTAGRFQPKSEVLANVHTIDTPDDDAPETLERLFRRFLGEPPSPTVERWGKAAARLHHLLKPAIGREIGKDNKDRHCLSKREIRRAAGLLRRAAARDPSGDREKAFERSLRCVYEAMFSHEGERAFVRSRMEEVLGRPVDSDGLDAGLAQDLLSQGEPVLLIAEPGARTSEMARAAAGALSAEIEPVDAAPEQGELELLGGWLPNLGERPSGRARSRLVRGRLTRHLMTLGEMSALAESKEKPGPVVLWLRNVDQWSEEIRTALNGLLEDGFIDLEDSDGKVTRLYKPPHLHLLAEIPADSTREFSSAFFSRWVKIGVSQDSVEPGTGGGASEFERVLRSRYGLDPLEAHWTARLRAGLSKFDEERRWANRGDRRYQAGIFFALARALVLSRREDPRWSALLGRIGREGYDPRADPWAAAPGRRPLIEDYWTLCADVFARESRRLVAARLSGEAAAGEIPDADRFEKILEAVLGRRAVSETPALSTEDGTLDGRLASAGGVPVAPGSGAEGLRSAARAARTFLSPQVERALGILARASTLGMVAAFAGETGSVKTSVCALWARLSGKLFYKYQAHGGSEISDLTIDFEVDASGGFRKRVKDFYRLLREGNVLIDLDEANLAPWVLWTLEPILRGENWVYPIFPEEPPFRVGPGVQIAMTFNPTRYSARHAIDEHVMRYAIPAWMGLASPREIERVVASFYGVWEETAAPEEKPEAPAPEPFGEAPEARKGVDGLMRKGVETFDADAEPSFPPDAVVRGVFDPELFPYTRLSAFDAYDESSGEWVRGGSLRLEKVPRPSPGEAEALVRELEPTHDLFSGRVRMSLARGWQGLPAAGPGMRFIELGTFDESGRPADVGLELARDSADNVFVRAREPASAALRYRVAVPAAAFGAPIPEGVPFRYPDRIPPEVMRAMGLIGLKGDEKDFREVLHALARFFRGFSLDENGIVRSGGSRYLDIVLSRCGVCRHRAFAFARTALGLGIPARLVSSAVHAWAEVLVPGLGWMRVDLGGGGDPMRMDLSALGREAHSPRFGDGLPIPEAFQENQRRMGERMSRALDRQGIRRPGAGRGGPGPAADSDRILAEVDAIGLDLAGDARVHDELAPFFERGKGDSQFVFNRMLRSLRGDNRIEKLRARSGLEIDAQALLQRKPKPFIRRKKASRMRATALSVLIDFSGSMDAVKESLAYAVAVVGENFWKLREAAPEHFLYGLSSFGSSPHTYVQMGARLGEKENAARVAGMANAAGLQGGTDILGALSAKLSEFQESRPARMAKVKGIVVVTDGADERSVVRGEGRWRPSRAMARLLAQCAEAGIDVTFIGIGPAAEQVRAFDGPRQRFVRVDASRCEDVAEAIAKLSELGGKGARLPDGELNAIMQIPVPGR
jgi:MoxR-like ATPase